MSQNTFKSKTKVHRKTGAVVTFYDNSTIKSKNLYAGIMENPRSNQEMR